MTIQSPAIQPPTSKAARRTTGWFLSLFAAFSLMAAACGDGAEEFAADADSEGVARSFCDAVADLGATIDVNAPATDQASAAAAAVELMPADAPGFATTYFSAIAEATKLDAAGEDSGAARAAWANGQHLQVATFLGSTCPDNEYASAESFQGMVAMGMQMQSDGDLSEVPLDSDETTAADDTTADEPTETTSSATSDDAPADSAAGAVTTTELGDVGSSTTYNMTKFVVGPVFATNAELDTIFDAEPAPGNANWLVVEILGETQANISTSYASGLFSLIAPDGQTITADQFTDSFGESVFDLAFDGRENKSAFALFQTPLMVDDLEGWRLVIEVGDEIPAFIPMTGASVPPVEPIVLDPVDGAITTGDNVYNDNLGCVTVFEVDVISAVVSLETSYRDRLFRSRVGERFLTVEVDVTNITDESIDDLCDEIGASFEEPNLRLSTDGRRQGPIDFGDLRVVDPGATVAYVVTYVIPADATELALLGTEDTDIFGTWQVEIPAVPGE